MERRDTVTERFWMDWSLKRLIVRKSWFVFFFFLNINFLDYQIEDRKFSFKTMPKNPSSYKVIKILLGR